MTDIRESLSHLLAESLRGITGQSFSDKETAVYFEAPREEKYGDIATSVALKIAKDFKKSPRSFADDLCREFGKRLAASDLKARIEKITVEGPGFINFHYSSLEIASVLNKIHRDGDGFGRPNVISKKRILLEFVSANPTGPLTVAHGRQAALGDSLARILRFCGHEVHKEYYNNDEGVQITLLGRSIRARYLNELGIDCPFPEDGYKGAYIVDLGKELVAEFGDKKAKEKEEFFSRFGKEKILEGIKKDLSDFGVSFDSYYSQEVLMRSGQVETTLEALRKKGYVFEKEGAQWFESTRFGDDKDRVLVKSDKSYTYLMPDIAYHLDKLNRKFQYLINILGPDHHGYIPRIKAAVEALGGSRDSLEILIAQLVTLYQDGKVLRMSTRAGEFVTLREVLDEVGKAAGRFFFLMRKFDAHLDFDLSLAKSQTPENPVFYIQYAHARIESIRGLFEERKLSLEWKEDAPIRRLVTPVEVQILRTLSKFESVVAAAEKTLEPFRLVPYLQELAGQFHHFYAEHRVVTEDQELTEARMRLVLGVQTVIRLGLGLLGVEAPRKM